ncbi:hypothetical protein EX30DRAFT_361434 [Ascodesmis nigricans]|uniref:Transcription initiation factor TFIID subunit 8 n=1 Tax=Ascodesmis nigricans TaxID=341454 RepID=A0A4V3SJX1_9PEZI|nr:hypothetical protein EX30DRAFT_361434 [Ascodesmis nigricans]
MTTEPRKRRRRNLVPPAPTYPDAAVIVSEDIAASILQRSIAQLLLAAGFAGADPLALEEMRRLAEQRFITLLQTLSLFTGSHRRTRATIFDFEDTLNLLHIPVSDLYHEARTHFTRAQPTLPPPPPPLPAELPPPNLDNLLGAELKVPKKKRPYKHLPDFPSSHTWKATPVFAERPSEPREIREKATQEARLAEVALRKLLVAGSMGRHGIEEDKKGNDTPEKEVAVSGRKREREKLWDLAVEELEKERRAGFAEIMDGSAGGSDMFSDVVVNAESKYWRKGNGKRVLRA